MTKPTSRFAHSEGKCALCYSPDGRHIITGGADTFVRIFDASSLSAEPRQIEHHAEPVTAIAMSAQGDRFATGCEDNMAALFAFPAAEFEGNATRGQAAVCDLAFSPSGQFLAVACEDGNIRHVNHATSQVTMLKGHADTVLSLAYDPQGAFLASASADGTVRIWATDDGSVVEVRDHGFGKIRPADEATCSVAWHPDGTQLAISGPRGVQLVDRDTWALAHTLSGHGAHGPQLRVAWSGSGQYLAACGLDRNLFVWDLASRETLGKYLCDSPVCSIAWSPVHNALAFVDRDGSLSVWDGVVPPHYAHPATATHAKAKGAAGAGGAGQEEEDDAALEAALAAALEAEEDDAAPAQQPVPKRRLATNAAADAGDGDDDAGDGGARAAPARRVSAVDDHDDMVGLESAEAKEARMLELELALRREERLKALRDEHAAASAPPPPQPVDVSCAQESVQPGSTPYVNRRRFLVWNLTGSVVSRDEDAACTIEIEFADAERHRPIRITDHYRFTLAALDDDGVLFASAAEAERASTLAYRPFNSWAANSEWQAQLPDGEEATCVALGYKFAAVGTSARNVRLFSHTGRPLALWTAAAPIVSMAGHAESLAVVEHGGRGALPGEQCLRVRVYSTANERRVTRLLERPLPLSEGATLSWLGFSSGGLLGAVDSVGVVRLCVSACDHEWMPVLDTRPHKKSKSERHWVVGLTDSQLLFVVCKGGAAHPAPLPRPVLTWLTLSVPAAQLDGGGCELEAEQLLQGALLEERRGALRAATDEESAEAIRSEVLGLVGAADRATLMQIKAACSADRIARALDLAAQLRLPRSVEGAIALANHFKHTQLAERIAYLMELSFGASGVDDVDATFDPAPARGPYALHGADDARAGADLDDACARPLARPAARVTASIGEQAAEARREEALKARRDAARSGAARFPRRSALPAAAAEDDDEDERAADEPAERAEDENAQAGGAADEDDGAEPTWVDEQSDERKRKAMNAMQTPGAAVPAARQSSNPFAKAASGSRVEPATTAKEVFDKLHGLKAGPAQPLEPLAAKAGGAEGPTKRKLGAPYAPTSKKMAKA